MVGHLLLRGMFVGLLAAFLAFGVAKVFGEPQMDLAIALEGVVGEAGHDHGAAATGTESSDGSASHSHDTAAAAEGGEHDHGELFSRATQSGIGLLTGLVIYGAAFGGLFSLVFAFAWGRMGNLGPRGTSAVLAALAFVALILVPGLKYPPNPPAVGAMESVGMRTELYLTMIILSLAGMVWAVWVTRRLSGRIGLWNAATLAGVVLAGAMTAVAFALPAVDEVPAGFPAQLLWHFRIASWGIQAALWAGIGLGFGFAAESLLEGQRGGAKRAVRAA